MTTCCDTSKPAGPGKRDCPVNGQSCHEVPIATVMHHIAQPWIWAHPDQAYYFCDDPDCDVVYFGQNNSTIKSDSLRTKVGVKEQTDNSLICYCYGVNKQQSLTCPETKEFVIEQTRNHTCSCITSNPSGRCCLKDFPR